MDRKIPLILTTALLVVGGCSAGTVRYSPEYERQEAQALQQVEEVREPKTYDLGDRKLTLEVPTRYNSQNTNSLILERIVKNKKIKAISTYSLKDSSLVYVQLFGVEEKLEGQKLKSGPIYDAFADLLPKQFQTIREIELSNQKNIANLFINPAPLEKLTSLEEDSTSKNPKLDSDEESWWETVKSWF